MKLTYLNKLFNTAVDASYREIEERGFWYFMNNHGTFNDPYYYSDENKVYRRIIEGDYEW